MNVKNRKCIRKLSLKSLYANRRRNLIAIFAIALTTLLFTSMFTIVLSLNASYETYQFRQVGGYAHGTFKDVSPEQAERIAAHPKVKAAGARKVIGITAAVSYTHLRSQLLRCFIAAHIEQPCHKVDHISLCSTCLLYTSVCGHRLQEEVDTEQLHADGLTMGKGADIFALVDRKSVV